MTSIKRELGENEGRMERTKRTADSVLKISPTMYGSSVSNVLKVYQSDLDRCKDEEGPLTPDLIDATLRLAFARFWVYCDVDPSRHYIVYPNNFLQLDQATIDHILPTKPCNHRKVLFMPIFDKGRWSLAIVIKQIGPTREICVQGIKEKGLLKNLKKTKTYHCDEGLYRKLSPEIMNKIKSHLVARAKRDFPGARDEDVFMDTCYIKIPGLVSSNDTNFMILRSFDTFVRYHDRFMTWLTKEDEFVEGDWDLIEDITELRQDKLQEFEDAIKIYKKLHDDVYKNGFKREMQM